MIIYRSQVFSVLQSTASKSFFIRNMSVSVKSLIYKEYGEPGNVVQLSTSMLDKPKQNEVSVKWILAPVNPADINTIQGKYPSKPSLPAIPGNEGVGEIVAVGPGVQELNIGDQVVPKTNHLGTWRTHMNCKSEDVMKIPKEVSKVEASMITVNPPTAYRMLKDYVTLQPGDTVIQNGGNSAVGQLVIQLCKAWNYKSVNIVRDRPNIQELKKQLMNLGATEVFTEEEIRTTTIFKSKQLPAPKLALNCICGQSGVNILRHLEHNGVMVTYGGMSREPITVPASALIFKNTALRGFWMTAWSKANANSQERVNMFKELTDLFVSKQLEAPPHRLVPFSAYQEAVTKALDIGGKTGVKYILDMSKS